MPRSPLQISESTYILQTPENNNKKGGRRTAGSIGSSNGGVLSSASDRSDHSSQRELLQPLSIPSTFVFLYISPLHLHYNQKQKRMQQIEQRKKGWERFIGPIHGRVVWISVGGERQEHGLPKSGRHLLQDLVLVSSIHSPFFHILHFFFLLVALGFHALQLFIDTRWR